VHKVIVFAILLQCTAIVAWSEQPKDWDRGKLISLKRGRIYDTYEIFSGRCKFVGKRLRSFDHSKVTEGAEIDFAAGNGWLYFLDIARKTHKARLIEIRLAPLPSPESQSYPAAASR
jgi:hypothetical protein